MVFRYTGLKEYVREDFERFYRMGFREEEIVPAVLDEYRHGEDFSVTEEICIHIFLAMNCAEKGFDPGGIVRRLKGLLTVEALEAARDALGPEYAELTRDLNKGVFACLKC